jgi:flagella basal body P-ring formation protein FlgA
MKILVWSALMMLVVLPAVAGETWKLVLPDTVVLDQGLARLEDIASDPVPASVKGLVVRAGLEPGVVVAVSRQDILRRLVTAGLSRGVKFRGASRCHLLFRGQSLTASDLDQGIRRIVQPLVPPALPGAPDSWFEMEFPETDLTVAGEWQAQTDRSERLKPGRNLVRVEIRTPDQRESLTVAVVLHHFGEVGKARISLERDQVLSPDQFDWEWQDLADLEPGLAIGRDSVQGASLTRNVRSGNFLRLVDLKETPVIMAGDPVELEVRRGQVAVTVRAFARQDGCLGQTIPVRSELTGRLVNARVAGPGRVEWRK